MYPTSIMTGAYVFTDIAALRSALVARDPSDFVSHFIFEPVPFLFNADFSSWLNWKRTLGDGIEIDPRDIVLTGSASIGYSLNPNKALRPFTNSSDIDCGVISSYHFDVAWRHLRRLRPSWLSLPSSSRRAIERHRTNYIFSGTIATESILGILPFGTTWQRALDKMSGVPPTQGREVRLRIYKDYESLRAYQAHNIKKLRDDLLATPSSDDHPITIEG
mgnify:CR=1 FL=1